MMNKQAILDDVAFIIQREIPDNISSKDTASIISDVQHYLEQILTAQMDKKAIDVRQMLHKLIYDFLLDFKCMYTVELDTDDGLPLVDLLSPVTTIKEGKAEIQHISEELGDEIYKQLTAQEGEARIVGTVKCPACNAWISETVYSTPTQEEIDKMDKKMTVTLSWDVELGEDWMNVDNLKALLYSTASTLPELLTLTVHEEIDKMDKED